MVPRGQEDARVSAGVVERRGQLKRGEVNIEGIEVRGT